MKTITISDFRKDIKAYCDYVTSSKDIITIPRTKRAEAIVLMSMSEYNSLKETEHLLSTAANREWLEESIEQAARGELIEYKEE